MHSSRFGPLGLLLLIATGCDQSDHQSRVPEFLPQHIGTDARLQAVSVIDRDVAWVSGVAGTYGRTVDGGDTWHVGVVPEADSLQFRDVHAVSADTAYLLSAGTGDASRIYKTADGGLTWRLQWVSQIPTAFFDCFAFWDARTGIAFSDAVDGAFVILRTEDGLVWNQLSPDRLPPALEGEGSFAASGTCAITLGDSAAWIGTGNAERSRLLHTTDRGRSWSVMETPIVAGSAAGITSVAFRSGRHGVLAGGEIGEPDAMQGRMAYSENGGATWQLLDGPPFRGSVYGAAYASDADTDWLVTVGPGGAAYSGDDGSTWVTLDTLSYWGLGFSVGGGWLAGPDGRLARIRFD